jgi:hypothetical protein
MKKSEVYIGMEVTLKEPMCGEHFGRAYPEPLCKEPHSFVVQPGMRGIVAAIDVPCVFHTKGNPARSTARASCPCNEEAP